MNFEATAASRRPRTDHSTIPVEWNNETPVTLTVRQKQSLDCSAQPPASEGEFTDESEYDSLFRDTQARLDRIRLSIAQISPFYGIRRAPQECKGLQMPPARSALTVNEPACGARP